MRPRAVTPLAPHGERRASPAHELTRNSILRISDAKTIELIQEWEKRECLWNTNLPDYPNKDERALATAVIAEKLDLPNFYPEHVTMKFKNLRNSYCQELKKMATDAKYKPKVFWFSYMDRFLRPHLQKINTILDTSKAAPKDQTTYRIVKTELDSGEEDNDEDWVIESVSGEASGSNSIRIESTFSEKTPSENGENSNQSQSQKRKLSRDSTTRSDVLRRRRSENGEHTDPLDIGNAENQVKIVQKKIPRKEVTIATQPGHRQTDCYDSFGTYIASLLRTLPHKTALMLQPKIVELIASVGLEEMNDDDSDC